MGRSQGPVPAPAPAILASSRPLCLRSPPRPPGHRPSRSSRGRTTDAWQARSRQAVRSAPWRAEYPAARIACRPRAGGGCEGSKAARVGAPSHRCPRGQAVRSRRGAVPAFPEGRTGWPCTGGASWAPCRQTAAGSSMSAIAACGADRPLSANSLSAALTGSGRGGTSVPEGPLAAAAPGVAPMNSARSTPPACASRVATRVRSASASWPAASLQSWDECVDVNWRHPLRRLDKHGGAHGQDQVQAQTLHGRPLRPRFEHHQPSATGD